MPIGKQSIVVDDMAKRLMPEDASERRRSPVCVKAGGNCFARSLSLPLFGDGDQYLNAIIRGMEDELLTTLLSPSDHYC